MCIRDRGSVPGARVNAASSGNGLSSTKMNNLVTPGTEPEVQIRIRMGQSSNIVAVVRSNGQLFSATKSTRVTLGGCGA